MRTFRIIAFLVFAFISIGLSAQDNPEKNLNKIDSLERVLKKTKKSDLDKIHYKIAENYWNLTDYAEYDNNNTYSKVIEETNLSNKLAIEDEDQFFQGSSLFLLGQIYGYVGSISGDIDSIELSINLFTQAINIISETDSINFLAKIYNAKSTAFYNIDNYTRSIEVCDSTLLLDREKVKPEFITECLYLKAISLYRISDTPGAINTFKELNQLATEVGDTMMISRSLNSLGNFEYMGGNYSSAFNYFFQSLKIHEVKKEEEEAALRKVNIGNVLKEMSQFEQALQYYNEALNYFQQKNDQDSKGYATDCLNNIGIIYNNQKKFDEAESFYEEALALGLDLGDSTKLMQTYINLGFTQTDKEEFSKARQSYQRALRIANAMGDQRRIALISGNLGDVFQSDNKSQDAINYYNSSLKIALDLGIKEIQKQCYKGLADAYEMLGDHKKALDFYKLYSNTKDSLLNESTQQIISELNTKYQTEQKEKDNQLLKSNNETLELKGKRDQLVKWGMGFIITLILVFAVFVYIQLQEKKKKNILLAEQKEEIETQRDEIMAQKDLLAKQKQEITDSIYYARRIQRAVLPPEQAPTDILPEHFILFKPRDIVSGDFYWMTKRDNKTILVDADCTGHGVPGAFMSMLGVSFLNEIVSGCDHMQANLILNELRQYVKSTLGQTGKQDEAKDGMDISLCIIEWDNKKIQYAGAYNPLYYFKKGAFNEIKADKMPIGVYLKDQEPFTNNVVDFEKGDTFYIFSDGYVSQFGGTDGRKFMSKPFKSLLESIQSKSMKEQMKLLDEALLQWQGNYEQVDDISVIGFRF